MSGQPLHVLIAGAGVVGLTLAQGCRQHEIPFTIFESVPDRRARSEGWALTLHWGLRSLRRTIGPELVERLPTALVNPTLRQDDWNFLFLNAETGDVRFKILPTKERHRLHRPKLLDLLGTGIDIQWGKSVQAYELSPDGVNVTLDDGSKVTGSMLVGADGNNSNIRRCLFPDPQKSRLTKLPVNLLGVVRHFTPDEGAEARALDPLLFHGMHPKTSSYLWYSVQEVYEDPDGRASWDALVLVSWPVKDLERDAIPTTNKLRIAMMKERAREFADPLRRIVHGIPDDIDEVTPLALADFSTLDWETRESVTLIGDAAHAMTMYRGEAANHGVLDAALLIDQLVRVKKGEIDQGEAIAAYEEEMKPRCSAAVLKSRQAALDGHHSKSITAEGPLIGGRFPPATA